MAFEALAEAGVDDEIVDPCCRISWDQPGCDRAPGGPWRGPHRDRSSRSAPPPLDRSGTGRPSWSTSATTPDGDLSAFVRALTERVTTQPSSIDHDTYLHIVDRHRRGQAYAELACHRHAGGAHRSAARCVGARAREPLPPCQEGDPTGERPDDLVRRCGVPARRPRPTAWPTLRCRSALPRPTTARRTADWCGAMYSGRVRSATWCGPTAR